jgi:protein involved in polysaccharide export with SLBB domain
MMNGTSTVIRQMLGLVLVLGLGGFLLAAEGDRPMPWGERVEDGLVGAQGRNAWSTPLVQAPASEKPAPPAVARAPSDTQQWATAWSWFGRSQPVVRLGYSLLERPVSGQGRALAADYRVQPGDLVRLVAWGGVQLNVLVPVDAQGNLGTPEHGMVPIAGRTVTEAQTLVLDLLRSHFRSAGAVISVERASVTAVTVTGEVNQPGAVLVPPGGTVIEALIQAGAVAPQGSMRAIRVTIPGSEAQVVDLYQVLLRGDLALLRSLAPGSSVFVPMAGPQVVVFGAARRVPKPTRESAKAVNAATGLSVAPKGNKAEVTAGGIVSDKLEPVHTELPSTAFGQLVSVPSLGSDPETLIGLQVELRPGEPLSEALACAGGPTEEADRESIRLVREVVEGQRLVQHTLAELAAIPAVDGDRLLLAQRALLGQGRAAIQVAGAVRTPGLYGWRDGLTIDQVLAAAGGGLPAADLAGITVRRRLAVPQAIELAPGLYADAYEAVLPAGSQSLVLQAGDVLVVPVRATLDKQILTVSVEGAVQRPGQLPLGPGMTVRDLVNLAGGLTADAHAETADVVRSQVDAHGVATVERLSVDLKKVINGDPGLKLRNRDSLVVRRRASDRIQVTIKGEVLTPGELVLPVGTTLRNVLVLAGGFTAQAFPRGARLERVSERRAQEEQLKEMSRRLSSTVAINQRRLTGADNEPDKKALEASIANQQAELVRMQTAGATGRLAGIRFTDVFTGDKDADVPLADGDLITIPPVPRSIRVVGEVMAPGSMVFELGLRPADLIARSGGFTRQADGDMLFVVRADGSVVATEGKRGSAWDPANRRYVRTSVRTLDLLDGDTIVVPPDLSFHASGMTLLKDWSTVLFQIASAAGTIAVLNNK